MLAYSSRFLSTVYWTHLYTIKCTELSCLIFSYQVIYNLDMYVQTPAHVWTLPSVILINIFIINKYKWWAVSKLISVLFKIKCTKWKQKQKSVETIHKTMCMCVLSCFSHVQFLQPYGSQTTTILYPCDSPGENTRVGCHNLLQEIFLTQVSNLNLFISPGLVGRFFTTIAAWEAPINHSSSEVVKSLSRVRLLRPHGL